MSYKNEFQSNNSDLQSILNTVNSLPVYENIDSEISTQDDLIAQIASALEGKTVPAGSSNEGAYCWKKFIPLITETSGNASLWNTNTTYSTQAVYYGDGYEINSSGAFVITSPSSFSFSTNKNPSGFNLTGKYFIVAGTVDYSSVLYLGSGYVTTSGTTYVIPYSKSWSIKDADIETVSFLVSDEQDAYANGETEDGVHWLKPVS